jgi:hypothetical protein
MTTREVYLDNDWEFEYDVKRKATTTGSLEAAASLSGVSAFFSATDGGTAIASTTTSLSERSATAGRYFGILDKTTLNTALSTYVNTTVYEVFVVSGDAETSEPILVKGSRRPA